MVVPGLRSHLKRDNDSSYGDYSGYSHFGFLGFQLPAEDIPKCCHTHAAPDGEGIEGTGVGVVALTRLHRCLVQVDDDGESGHKEQEEDDPELFHTFLPTEGCLPDKS